MMIMIIGGPGGRALPVGPTSPAARPQAEALSLSPASDWVSTSRVQEGPVLTTVHPSAEFVLVRRGFPGNYVDAAGAPAAGAGASGPGFRFLHALARRSTARDVARVTATDTVVMRVRILSAYAAFS